jgi:hypothetical protein
LFVPMASLPTSCFSANIGTGVQIVPELPHV